MLKNSLFSPLCLAPFFCFSLFLFFFFFLFSAAHLFFFSVSCFSRYCSAPALFFFSFCVLPFIFQPKILLFQPKRFSAQKHFFQPKTFLLQFSHSSLLLFFPALFFSSSAIFSLFQCLLFFFSLAPFIQDPIFALAASHLFYLNKSLFSSNLE